MPHTPEKTYDLNDFAGLLAGLDREGYEFIVIGGCAVGAYGRLMDQQVLSGDLDLYATRETMFRIIAWAELHGAELLKRPRPRSLQVALLRWHDDKRFDVLSEAPKLPPAPQLIRNAREFTLSRHGVDVPVIDPLDLLANKLAVKRPKDEPHIEVLKRFIEEEAVTAFVEETSGRRKIAPAARYLDVLGRDTLPSSLAVRLIELADHPAAFRFLAGRLPDRELALRLAKRAADRDLEVGADVIDIVVERLAPRR